MAEREREKERVSERRQRMKMRSDFNTVQQIHLGDLINFSVRHR